MGDCISSSRKGVVPTLVEGHLAIIKDQNPYETCVTMSICYMLYVFLMKYYVKEDEELKKIDNLAKSKKVDIQHLLMEYLVKAFHKDSDGNNPIKLGQVPLMVRTVATAFGCDSVPGGRHTNWGELKAFMKAHNTIHCCMIICKASVKLQKFFVFFRGENKKNEYTSVEEAQVTAPSEGPGDVGHAMVAINCYKQQTSSKEMIKGANSWGTDFGDDGYFRCEYSTLEFFPHTFTFKKIKKKPSTFTLPIVGDVTEARTINASDLIGNTVCVKVPWGFTVGQVKQAIANQVGVKASNIDLIYREKVVTDDMNSDDIDYNPTVHFRIFYHSYDNSKKRITLDGKDLVVPNIYTLHGANPLTHKIFSEKHALSLMVHNPKKKTVSYYGPYYNVPDSFNCDQIGEQLKKHHNLSFNFKGGVFFKFNPYKQDWMKIRPNFSLRNQLKFLPGTSYIVLNVQQ